MTSEAPTGPGLSRGALAGIFAIAVLAQLWILRLPFRQDDYLLLREPLSLFRTYAQAARSSPGEPVSFLRFPLWGYWALLRALGGDPLRPIPFQLANLLLHGAASALLAACVARLGTPRSGLVAGLLFGLSCGAIQAVHWPSAGADLLMTLFGLASLAAFLGARRKAPGRGRGWAGLWLVLALLSKSPALLLVAALPAVLWSADRRARRSAWRADAWILAAALAVLLVARWLFVGHLRLGYGSASPPGLAELPGVLRRSLLVLGQALYPWNASPLFDDTAPLLGRLLGTPPRACAFAGAVVLGGWAAAGAASRPARAPLFVCLVLAPALALPSALLLAPPGSNLQSRTAYLALAPLASGSALAVAALWGSRPWRPAAVAFSALLLALLADGGVHLARTELLAAAQVRAARGSILDSARAHRRERPERSFRALVVAPTWGLGGIPTLTGGTLAASLRAPFQLDPEVDVSTFASLDELVEGLGSGDGEIADVRLFAPDPEVLARPGSPGSGRQGRARLLLRGWWARSDSVLDRPGSGGWIPGHTVEAVELRFPPGPALEGAVRIAFVGPDAASGPPATRSIPVSLGASETERRIAVGIDDVELRFAALVGASWSGPVEPLAMPTFRRRLPRASPPRLDPLAIDPRAAGPTVRVTPPPGWTEPRFARLELVLRPPTRRFSFFADFDLEGVARGSDGALELGVVDVHFARDALAGGAVRGGVPWATLIERFVLPPLRERGVTGGEVTVRVRFFHRGGALAARSPASVVPFEVVR